MSPALNGRSKPLVRWVIRPAAGAGLGIEPLGVVVTHGADESYALLVAALRWRMSQRQLVAMKWDDCPPLTRFDAAVMERKAVLAMLDECRSALGAAPPDSDAWREPWRSAVEAERRGHG